MFDQVIFSNMKVSAPNIIGLIECLQNQPQQINVLERYTDWIESFINMNDGKVLYQINPKFKFVTH
jgi:hypothetical protein